MMVMQYLLCFTDVDKTKQLTVEVHNSTVRMHLCLKKINVYSAVGRRFSMSMTAIMTHPDVPNSVFTIFHQLRYSIFKIERGKENAVAMFARSYQFFQRPCER